MTLERHLSCPVTWRRTGQAEFPYAASLSGQDWKIRVNDFPVDPLYTLLIDGREVGDFDDWPSGWRRPD